MARPLATKYQRRISSLKRETSRLRGDVGHVLHEVTVNAVDEQKYERTPLPVTGALRRSVKLRMQGNNSVAVVFDTSVAPHAPIVLNMHGVSKTGGHLLDMRIGEALRQKANPRIRRLGTMAQRRILEAK